jgi:hypothetical protein
MESLAHHRNQYSLLQHEIRGSITATISCAQLTTAIRFIYVYE